jgi:site-specific DNA-methyltransferase (adenine-specific)
MSAPPTPYYEESGITVYHGDCREILPMLPAGSVDLVLTDPPYGHNNNNGDLIHRREEALGLVKRGTAAAGMARPIANDGPEANELVRWAFGEFNRLLKPGCCCCCGGGGGGPDPQFARWALWLDEAIAFKQAVVWDKGGLGMGWHYRRNYELMLVGEKPGAACKWYGGHSQANVVRIPGIRPDETEHPTLKPLELMALFVRLHSEPSDLVLDPFMGSGTTLVAAKQLGRRAIGIEIEERYCEIGVKRLAQAILPLAPPALGPEQLPMEAR